MPIKTIDPFDEFYCMSSHDSDLAFTVREIYETYNKKVCIDRKSIHRFGENLAVKNVETPIHPWGEFEDYQTSNVILNLCSSDNADTSTVTIEYMSFDVNGDFVFATQTKTLTGQTPVTLNDTGCRWMRMYTDDAHVGDIWLYRGDATSGVPDDLTKVHNQILIGASQSQKASTSVAKDNYMIVTHIWSDVIRKTGTNSVLNFKTKALGGTFKNILRRGLSDSNALKYECVPRIIIEPNTDIEITAQTDSMSDTDMTAGFNGYFADIISSD
tara:strand:- start:33373 stop:34185 length:813 start_codon:yes stop_codon:yes gene_type:complete